MTHPLYGARLKVIRAQEHLDSLRLEAKTYLDTKPYAISVSHVNGRVGVVAPVVNKQPPPHLSLIAGDCLTNVRAALDHIVWQLAIRHFAPPLVEKDRGWVSFPITEDPKIWSYVSKINGFANRNMPAAAINEIQLAQPCNAGYQPLWWLHELVNTDKHRMILLTLGFIESAQMRISDSAGRVQDFTLTVPPDWVAINMAEIAPDNPIFLDDMRVNLQATSFVAFKDFTMPREPLDRTLEQIIETVANLFPRFERFF